MDARQLVPGHREEAPRILLAEVVLAGEREAREILEGAQESAPTPAVASAARKKGTPAAARVHRVAEPRELERAPRLRRHRLRLRIPDHVARLSGPRPT